MTTPRPDALCPIRPGEPCTLCFPGADGPANCGLVYLVQDDEELKAAVNAQRAEFNRKARLARA
ncbi:MAG TPA: hypothetical protein GX743_04355 [Actinomycetales bacterium]|nr:hypothetical protein [Actinomycetales bacterium]